MNLISLFTGRAKENQWRRDFMTEAIRRGLSFDAAEKLSKSKRANYLMDNGLPGVVAYEMFEHPEI